MNAGDATNRRRTSGAGRAMAPTWEDAAAALTALTPSGRRTLLLLRAYPNNPAARKAINAQAKWRKAR